ncbi:MAG TPA: TIGR01459 family HAD-type hydrolase [Paracoccaceae bacterium]|nr:TIGR01459 family HAD-type hydrolase [Paracoccaceae bacterium]
MSCRIIQRLSDISDAYDAILCDLWGCYHNGIEPFPAAVEACREFRRRGKRVILLTNAPRPGGSVQRFMDEMGAPRESYDTIVSSGGACQAAVAEGRFGKRIHYVGPTRDLHVIEDIGLHSVPVEDADAVLVAGFRDDRTEHPDDYAPEIAAWNRRGLPVLCANPDLVVDRGEERLWCAGSIAKAHADAGGEVVYFGKPHAPIYERCFAVLEEMAGAPVPRERIVVAGDGIATDVAGGRAMGLDTLFVTGGLAAAELGPDPENPDPARLERYLSDHGQAPRYAIGRLR